MTRLEQLWVAAAAVVSKVTVAKAAVTAAVATGTAVVAVDYFHWDLVVIALITMFSSIVTPVVMLLVGFWIRSAQDRQEREQGKMHVKLDAIGHDVNSQQTMLNETNKLLTRDIVEAEGGRRAAEGELAAGRAARQAHFEEQALEAATKATSLADAAQTVKDTAEAAAKVLDEAKK